MTSLQHNRVLKWLIITRSSD